MANRREDTRPIHHDGRSELPTVLEEISDPALSAVTRQQFRRVASLVDELVARQAGPAPASRDVVWALERRIRHLEWGSLALVMALIGWTGMLTAITVVVVVAAQ